MRPGVLLLATAVWGAAARPAVAGATATEAPGSYRPRLVVELNLGTDVAVDDAGTGVVLSALGSVTPFWVGRGVGLGAGLSFGWKHNGAGDWIGGAPFSGVPVAGFGQALLPLGGPWLSPLRAGPLKLVSTENGSGNSQWGLFVEWGVCRWLENRLGLVALLRYTHVDLPLQGVTVGADSFGVALGAAFGD